MLTPIMDNIYLESSPSRGTWIEINIGEQAILNKEVVPLAGDVD